MHDPSESPRTPEDRADPVFEAFAGGGEYNVSYALARYGMRTGWVSRLVDNPLGHFIKNHARASGMDISEVVWIP